ncbi:MAG TPA: hypothetical protein VMB50_03235 [Myxococcales bacterium]|nr:hypothetical protein [Myxococcales bacterium]
MRNATMKWAMAGLCCSALACGQTKVVGSQYAASALISATQGGSLSVTASEDAKLAGTEIQIPPTALAQDTTVTITEGVDISSQLPSGDSLASAAVAEFGPSGTAFSLPVTVTLPYSAGTTSDLEVVAVEDDGTTLVVSNADLTLDTQNNLAKFTVAGFTRFAVVHGVHTPCPANDTLCGCNGGGKCVPPGTVCPAICPVTTGGNGGGSGGTSAGSSGGSGGSSCCPAGDYFCGCNGSGTCVPDNVMCELNCPFQSGAGGTSGGSGASAPPPSAGTPPAAVCCPPGDYFCGCNGQGSCVSDNQACPALCPATSGGNGGSGSGGTTSGGSGGGCCPGGDYWCGCPGETGSCVPDGQSCVIACPAQPSTGGATTTPPSIDCCPAGEFFCGCNGVGQCLPSGEACPLACPTTGGGSGGNGCSGPLPPCAYGLQAVCLPDGQWTCEGGGGCVCGCPATGPCDCSCDGGTVCPANEVQTACGCLPPNVLCVPPGCPSGETECCGQCLPAGEACSNISCPQDGGSPPPCACACPANDPACTCACGDAGSGPPTCGCACAANDPSCTCTCADAGPVCTGPLPPCATGQQPVCQPDGQWTCQGVCASGSTPCCDGTCATAGSVCPTVCAADAGACQPGYTMCNGSCIVDTLPCGVCSSGESLCCGKCQPSGQACSSVCADAG